MRVRVTHGIGDLARDCAAIPPEAYRKGSGIVGRYSKVGASEAKRLARAKAGPHGEHYFKRISAERTGPLTAEYGPDGIPKTDFVGVGFRHGVNTDLPTSADLVGPKFHKAIGDMVDGLFWPGGDR